MSNNVNEVYDVSVFSTKVDFFTLCGLKKNLFMQKFYTTKL